MLLYSLEGLLSLTRLKILSPMPTVTTIMAAIHEQRGVVDGSSLPKTTAWPVRPPLRPVALHSLRGADACATRKREEM